MSSPLEIYKRHLKRELQTCASQENSPLIDTPREVSCAKTILEKASRDLSSFSFGFDGFDPGMIVIWRMEKADLQQDVEQGLRSLSSSDEASRDFFVFVSPTEKPLLQAMPCGNAQMGVFTIYQGGGPAYHGSALPMGPRLDRSIFISSREWEDITLPLRVTSSSPEEERVRLGEVVARFEAVGGVKGGTTHDKGGIAGNVVLRPQCREGVRSIRCVSSPDDERRGQQDCADETHTIVQVLSALQVWGLLQHHTFDGEVADTFIAGTDYVHYASVIHEKNQPLQEWVVDSWPRDNGDLPDIIPVCNWGQRYSKEANCRVSIAPL